VGPGGRRRSGPLLTCLGVEHLTKSFGGLTAVNRVSFAVEPGSITGLIGPNGSGKTVTFDCITGFYTPDAGRVVFRDRDITGLPPDRIASHGIARSFQITGVFRRLSVRQNLVFAAQEKRIGRNLARVFRPTRADAGRVHAALDRFDLARVAEEPVASLSHGQQKMLELAGLTIMQPPPHLFLLDEPFAGLTAAEIAQSLRLLNDTRQSGTTLLIVEHNMRVIMRVCDRIVVLDHGEKIAEGAPAAIQADSRVVEAYLGSGAGAGRR
jgi:branched-chain amino acid transport system ATP-binding protein